MTRGDNSVGEGEALKGTGCMQLGGLLKAPGVVYGGGIEFPLSTANFHTKTHGYCLTSLPPTSALARCVPQLTGAIFSVLLFQSPTSTSALNAIFCSPHPALVCCVPQLTCACCRRYYSTANLHTRTQRSPTSPHLCVVCRSSHAHAAGTARAHGPVVLPRPPRHALQGAGKPRLSPHPSHMRPRLPCVHPHPRLHACPARNEAAEDAIGPVV